MGGRSGSSGAGGGVASENPFNPANAKAADCETRLELQEYFKTAFGIELTDTLLDKMDFATLKQGLIGVEAVLAEYKDVKNVIDKIDYDGANKDALAYYSASENAICFTKAMKNYADQTEEALRNGYLYGDYHPGVPDANAKAVVQQIFAHETGHAVENFIAVKLGVRDSKSRYLKTTFEDHYNVSREIIQQAYRNVFVKGTEYEKASNDDLFGKKGQNSAFKVECSKISGYASSNTDRRYPASYRNVHQYQETWAEAFADVYSNGSNAKPFSKEIYRLAKEKYKKVTTP